MKRKIIIIAITLVTIFNLSAISTFIYFHFFALDSFPPWAHFKEGKPYIMKIIKEELDLDEQQTERMSQIFDNFQNESSIIADSAKTKFISVLDIISATSIDTLKIENLKGEIHSLHGQLLCRGINFILEEKGVLNPEQQQKFFTLFKKMISKVGTGPMKGLGNIHK